MGGIDELKGDVDVAVVVVADFGNHKARFAVSDATAAQLQAIGGGQGHRHDAAVAVQQRQGDDARGQQTSQFRGSCSLRSTAAIGVHRRRHRTVQIDVTATGDPAPEISIGENTLQDPGFRDHKNQPRLVGGDLAQGRKNRVLGKNNELGEVPLDLDALHSSPRRCLSRTWRHYPTFL